MINSFQVITSIEHIYIINVTFVFFSFGGVIPHVARSMHRNNITKICEDALRAANLKLKDIDAIATTVKPGLAMSLNIGAEFGKYLTRIGEKPFIPIHHMEAHALTVRMTKKVCCKGIIGCNSEIPANGKHEALFICRSISHIWFY